MSVDLPKPIANYFSADKGDAAAVAQCFTENAVVKDEGHTYNGVDEIRRWKAESSTKYTYTVETIAVEQSHGKTIVTGHLVGNFPGSPVDLRYFFELEGAKIASLEIIP
jgi:SnoaL-like domain